MALLGFYGAGALCASNRLLHAASRGVRQSLGAGSQPIAVKRAVVPDRGAAVFFATRHEKKLPDRGFRSRSGDRQHGSIDISPHEVV